MGQFKIVIKEKEGEDKLRPGNTFELRNNFPQEVASISSVI